MTDFPGTKMNKYKCHKEVWAFRITEVFTHPDKWGMLYGNGERNQPFTVSVEFMAKHQPKVGGYYVQYEGGYESFSPADAFESGYTLIKEEE